MSDESTDHQTATILEVTGGAAGLEAAYAAVRELAAAYDAAGDRLREWAGIGRRTITDDDLLESGLLCPPTFLAAEAAVLDATTGPDGLLVEACGWELDARAIRAAVAYLEAADDAVHDCFEVLDYAVCRALGARLLHSAPLLTAGAAAVLTQAALLDQVRPGAGAQLLDDLAGAAEDALTEHPELVEHVANGGGGLLDGLAGGPAGIPVSPTTEDGAAHLAGLYGDDGRPHVRPVDGVALPGSHTQPGSLAELIAHLAEVAGLSDTPNSPLNGTVEVQTITGADGEVRHIVYLPGTDDLTTTPWTQDGDVRDMGTNAQLMAGQTDTYHEGILDAMHEAGVRPGEPVLLVGHSQGGMEAAAILSGGGSGYDVTDAITAGSPTAQVDGFPAGSHVTSLEQHGDVVPQLDGEPNPDLVEQTTVLVDADPDQGVLAHHGYPAYVEGAAAADASDHPSIVENVDSLHEHGFLGDGQDVTVTSQVLQITRDE